MLVTSRRSRVTAAVAAVITTAVLVVWPGLAMASAPAPVPSDAPKTPQERTAAIVSPAVVLVEVHWTGFLRNRTTGARWDDRPVSLTTSCSGITISNDGYVMTTGHCVDPGPFGVAPAFVELAVRRQVDEGRLPAANLEATVADLLVNTSPEGAREGEPLERQIYLQRGTATVAATEGEATEARVVALHTALAGNIALLKVDRSNQPMAPLADPGDLPEDGQVLVLGYPPAPTGATVDVDVRPGMVVAGPTPSPAAEPDPLPRPVQLREPPGPRLEGAPVTDLEGAVIGLVTNVEAEHTPGTVLLASPEMLADDLDANDVDNELGKIDNDFRAGLDAYTEGRYDDCIRSLDDVLAALPTHEQALALRQQAVALRQVERGPTGEQPPQPRPTRIPGWLVGVAAVAGALLAGALWRRWHPPPPVPVASSDPEQPADPPDSSDPGNPADSANSPDDSTPRSP